MHFTPTFNNDSDNIKSRYDSTELRLKIDFSFENITPSICIYAIYNTNGNHAIFGITDKKNYGAAVSVQQSLQSKTNNSLFRLNTKETTLDRATLTQSTTAVNLGKKDKFEALQSIDTSEEKFSAGAINNELLKSLSYLLKVPHWLRSQLQLFPPHKC